MLCAHQAPAPLSRVWYRYPVYSLSLASGPSRAFPPGGDLGAAVVHKVVRMWPINVDWVHWTPERLCLCRSGLQLVPLCHGLPGVCNHILPVLHLSWATLPRQVDLAKKGETNDTQIRMQEGQACLVLGFHLQAASQEKPCSLLTAPSLERVSPAAPLLLFSCMPHNHCLACLPSVLLAHASL